MKHFFDFKNLIIGIIKFYKNGTNSESAYQAFVKLYSISNGFSIIIFDFINKIILSLNNNKKTKINKKDLNIENEVFIPKISDNEETILNTIKKDSYYIFSSKLDEKICDDIIDYLFKIDGYGNKNLNKITKLSNKTKDVSYINFHEEDLIKNKNIQALCVNDLILKTCRNYFKSEPILSNIGIAVTYPTDAPKTEYAQLYHFDLDRIKWLKFFIYLTDVNENDGPHCFIKGTHKAFSKPYALVKKGYQRINDEEFFKSVDKNKEYIITGSRGTMFIGDSSAFHKGLNPSNRHRIMLQLEYTNSLFGAKVDRVKIKDDLNGIGLKKGFIEKYKLFERFQVI